jgi:hypothetical protein
MSIKEVLLCSPREPAPNGALVVNTTSRSTDFGKNLSPFMNQGPIELYGLKAHNVENYYQFNRIFTQEQIDNPQEWLKWRAAGLASTKAERYPLGKGHKPLFGYVNKKLGRMDYVQGRKLVYLPAYIQKLDRYCGRWICSLLDILTVSDVYLWDFDVRQTDETFDQILHNEQHQMGHAFIVRQYCLDIINGTDEVLRYRLK